MKVMILAAGKGKRLRPITNRIPKPLVRINGVPILAHHFEKLYVAGFRQVFVNISYLGHLIMKEFGNSYKGLNICYSLEPDPPLETAGGILFARPWGINNKPFLVINADVWCDWNVRNAEMIANGKKFENKLAHLVLIDRTVNEEGDFYMQNNLLYTKNDKSNNISKKLTYSGIGVYKPGIFNQKNRGKSSKLRTLLEKAINNEQVSGEKHTGCWFDIGTTERLEKLREFTKKE